MTKEEAMRDWLDEERPGESADERYERRVVAIHELHRIELEEGR